MNLKCSIVFFITAALIFLVILTGCQVPVISEQDNEQTEPVSLDSNERQTVYGWDHGYFWMLSCEGGTASISFPNTDIDPGNFAVTYSNVEYLAGGKGWYPGSDITFEYIINSLYGEYDTIGVYGWSINPLIEYSIVEKGNRLNNQYLDTLYSDGRIYDCYKGQRVNQPSIVGTATYWQYYSVCRTPVSIGSYYTLTTSNHITAWLKTGASGFNSREYMLFLIQASYANYGYMNATIR